MFGLRLPRLVTSLIAAGFLLIAVLLGTFYLLAPHVTLRITTGPAGSNAQRVISTFISALHPRIRFVTVPVPDLEASSKALEEGKVDIAVVRSDIKPPANGQTLVILRRDVIAIVPLSLLASLAAVVSGRLCNRKLEAEQRQIFRLLVIAEATKANVVELMALEAEFHRLVAYCVKGFRPRRSLAGVPRNRACAALDQCAQSAARRSRRSDESAPPSKFFGTVAPIYRVTANRIVAPVITKSTQLFECSLTKPSLQEIATLAR
jgi:hypothetical protein